MLTPRAVPASSSRSEMTSSGRGGDMISPILAAELGLEYASLRAIGNCPTGIYLTPSPETILHWHGVFFAHRGPYGGSILRFSLSFPISYPQTRPVIRFDSDVFHPMVDPKTKIWTPRRSSQWQPRVDHVPQLLHSLKRSFKTAVLAGITEDEAVNKQVWSLYHHSPQTFQSMTSQRALHSASRSTLYSSFNPLIPLNHNADNANTPSTPTPGTPQHRRMGSAMSEEDVRSPIAFREIGDVERERLWVGLRKSLGA